LHVDCFTIATIALFAWVSMLLKNKTSISSSCRDSSLLPCRLIVLATTLDLPLSIRIDPNQCDVRKLSQFHCITKSGYFVTVCKTAIACIFIDLFYKERIDGDVE